MNGLIKKNKKNPCLSIDASWMNAHECFDVMKKRKRDDYLYLENRIENQKYNLFFSFDYIGPRNLLSRMIRENP